METQRLIDLLFKHSLLVGAIAQTYNFSENITEGIWREERQVYEEICKIQNDLIDRENENN